MAPCIREKKAFYEYHASLMEPWDGPAAVAFTDGRVIGATLDRNGLRPARYLDDQRRPGDHGVRNRRAAGRSRKKSNSRAVCSRAECCWWIPPKAALFRMKKSSKDCASRQPYGQWLKENQITLDSLPEPPRVYDSDLQSIVMRQRAFGYTDEDIRVLLAPMAANGEEPVGSMGTDTPLACLSDKPQPLFHYFKQLFAQVTNPAIDPIREELVMSLTSYIGTERNILEETPQHCHTLKLPHPLLTNRDLEKLRRVSTSDLLATTLPMLFRVDGGEKELERRSMACAAAHRWPSNRDTRC